MNSKFERYNNKTKTCDSEKKESTESKESTTVLETS